jgi:hypothetical protein
MRMQSIVAGGHGRARWLAMDADAVAVSPFALLDAHSSLHLFTEAVHDFMQHYDSSP